MAEDFEVGERVEVAEIRDSSELPEDLVGTKGTIKWVTPGFAGERGYVEVQLDDGRVFQFQNKELRRLGQ
jgi:hypothetical protein